MQEGVTPLILAVMTGNAKVVERLLKSGADVNLKANNGTTPLAAAHSRADTSLVALLEAAGGK
jgi:ankyrin repeat protein